MRSRKSLECFLTLSDDCGGPKCPKNGPKMDLRQPKMYYCNISVINWPIWTKLGWWKGFLRLGNPFQCFLTMLGDSGDPKCPQKDYLEPPKPPGAPKLVFAISRVYIDRFEHTFFLLLRFLAIRNRLNHSESFRTSFGGARA